jgi:hypothetical protein
LDISLLEQMLQLSDSLEFEACPNYYKSGRFLVRGHAFGFGVLEKCHDELDSPVWNGFSAASIEIKWRPSPNGLIPTCFALT